MAHDSLFSFENLGTIGGASLLCFLIVAYTKGFVDKVLPWLPTNIYSLFIATIILMLVQLNIDHSALYLWQTYFLSGANGVLVSATASHTNDLAIRFPQFKKKTKENTAETIAPDLSTLGNGYKSLWYQGNSPVQYNQEPSNTDNPIAPSGTITSNSSPTNTTTSNSSNEEKTEG